MPTFGVELEKPISDSFTGRSHGVSQDFFRAVQKGWETQGKHASLHHSDINPQTIIGVTSPIGEQGLDNAFNNQESAVAYQQSLPELSRVVNDDLHSIQRALEEEGATVINMSIHPLAQRDPQSYRAFVAPKGIYEYIRYRGWDHTAGIDARAQNSPSTGVAVENAAMAVSAIIGAGAAFVGIYANSPYEEGKRAESKESRLTLWDRMMKNSKVRGDWETAQFPHQKFESLGDYFNWMFGARTGIHFVMNSEGDPSLYKSVGDQLLMVDGNPSVLDYLARDKWTASYLTDLINNGSTARKVEVTPSIDHMSAMQFAQFAGARIRYGIASEGFPLAEFLDGCKNPNSRQVEQIFEQYAHGVYIEGRDPGANFPDAQVYDVYGRHTAESVVMSPSAIQAGLIGNLSEVDAFLNGYNWRHLGQLRDEAIKNGLQGEVAGTSVLDFSKKIVELAARGLSRTDQDLLAYPMAVLRSQKNGADRAIQYVEDDGHTLEELVISRNMKLDI